MLTARERALLFRACWDHTVARCQRCAIELKGIDLRARDLCPSCRIDFTSAIRGHLLACAAAAVLSAGRVVADAKALHETSARLYKEARQLRDAAQIARAEAEAIRSDRVLAEEHHKGWDIEPQSYRSNTVGWRPKAFVIRVVAGSLRTHALAAPVETAFDSEIEANAYAVAMAKT
jgi:hypothetical protein